MTQLFIHVCVSAVLALTGQPPALVPLAAGMVIDRSVTIRPGTYRLTASTDLARSVITVRGENITIDFNGAVLTGGPELANPDTYTGVGLLIDGGSKVTLKNAVIRGYKIGILARRSRELRLSHNDLSYNWKPRLYSGIEKESLVDWMSYHQNDKDEWLTRGAGIYLSECDRAEIDHNTIVQGQNGLMITRSSGLKIWNNTFQFLSGIGVGLYRTTGSTITHNRVDWCVRGYSHGFYHRGQDSAGLLMYEQSSRNIVAHNSITHGGDGLFLWAGQSTMDTGKGGSNENLFFANDFSHAVTNGIEATFSYNRFVGNRVEDCWHGVWGGYSYGSEWKGNRFARNTEAIAIEHGLGNKIVANTFDGDETAIRLWQNPTQDPDWGYPKYRDTRSHGYLLERNTFTANKTALDVRATTGVEAYDNIFQGVGTRLTGDSTVDLDVASEVHIDTDELLPRKLADGIDPMIKDESQRGRARIIVDEWGPYDWKSPKLWPAGGADEQPLRLRVLGPPGKWVLHAVGGASISSKTGVVPGELVVTPTTTQPIEFTVTLDYYGGETISPRGARSAAGQVYRFSYRRFVAPIEWSIKFFEYGDSSDPVKQPAAFARLLSGPSIKTLSAKRLDYVSGRALEDGVPSDRFALVAEGTTTLPTGNYILQVISDDGVRMWMDGAMMLDDWTPHESKVSRVPIAGGAHRFKVEYFDVTGFAELRFDIQRK